MRKFNLSIASTEIVEGLHPDCRKAIRAMVEEWNGKKHRKSRDLRLPRSVQNQLITLATRFRFTRVLRCRWVAEMDQELHAFHALSSRVSKKWLDELRRDRKRKHPRYL